jgi:hypothetical protein
LAGHDRAAALSEQLVQVHQELRERLAALRRAPADGAPLAPAAGGMPPGLLGHCLGFCAVLRTHHSGEDAQLLPALRDAAPELAPVIDTLIEDHRLVAGILRRIAELLAPDPAGGPGPRELAGELDGLAAILESHFGYEERRIAAALDTLGPGEWVADVLTPGDLAGPLAGD